MEVLAYREPAVQAGGQRSEPSRLRVSGLHVHAHNGRSCCMSTDRPAAKRCCHLAYYHDSVKPPVGLAGIPQLIGALRHAAGGTWRVKARLVVTQRSQPSDTNRRVSTHGGSTGIAWRHVGADVVAGETKTPHPGAVLQLACNEWDAAAKASPMRVQYNFG